MQSGLTNRILCKSVKRSWSWTWVELEFQLMEWYGFWDSISITFYLIDAHDLKNGHAHARKWWKNTFCLSMNSALWVEINMCEKSHLTRLLHMCTNSSAHFLCVPFLLCGWHRLQYLKKRASWLTTPLCREVEVIWNLRSSNLEVQTNNRVTLSPCIKCTME